MLDSVHEPILTEPKRRTYSAEFKALLVREATDSGRSIASIAREHGINQNLLHNWKRQYQRAHAQADTLPGTINGPHDPNPHFIPIYLEPEVTYPGSASFIKNIKLQTTSSTSGSINLNIAPIENFWGVLNNELVYHHNYRTRFEAINSIIKYIELDYNQVRVHQSLRMRSPRQVW